MILNSLLENDFYKFTMQQAVLHNFPDVQVEIKFKCRQTDRCLLHLKERVQEEIEHLCSLTFKESELDYLRKIPFLKRDYIDFLRLFKLQKDAVIVYDDNGQLGITITGSWLHVIFFEVPILAIVNELYFADEMLHISETEENILVTGIEKLHKKISLVKESSDPKILFKFADFGMRRRFSGKWHDILVEILKKELPYNFIGTSNVYLAKKYEVGHIGTMAHEWLMVGQGLSNVRLADSQKYMLDIWAKEYRGDLGIALSDTLGFKSFLNDFDKYFCKLFDGCRHDSGDPIEWGEKLIEHYEKMGVDPKTKSAVFSDGLTFPLALQLAEYFNGWLKTSYGIGTNLTNDVGFDPLQIVMKIVRVNGNPVAKLSDSSGKCMCEDVEFLQYLKKVFNIN